MLIIEPNMKIQNESVDVLGVYADHLKNLTEQDRYTRFCYHIKDETIDQLILNILYNRLNHYLFSAVVNNKHVGFVHLARQDQDWELAVSVDKDYQGQGIADQLIQYAIVWGKTHGVHTVFMHCIAQNTKIQHLARKHGLRTVERDGSEITSQVELSPATTLDYTTSFLHEQRDLYNQINELQHRMLSNLNSLLFLKDHDLPN